MTIARKHRRKTPRFGSVAKACTDVSTPDRTRNAPSRLNENAAIASRTVQLLKASAFVRNRQRVNQGGPDEPGHEGRILHRIPKPPAAPPELVVGPEASKRDAAGKKHPGQRRPGTRPARPCRIESTAQSMPKSRRQTPPRIPRTPCRAAADGEPSPSPGVVDSDPGHRRALARDEETGSKSAA